MSGPKVVFTLPIFGGLPVSETIVNSWIIMAVLVIGSILLTRNLKIKPTRIQVLLEKGVQMLYDLVETSMGKDKMFFAPYIGTLFLFALFSNLMGLVAMRPPTADLNTTGAWALIMFGCIQVFSIKRKGFKARITGFAEPIAIVLPLNLIGEFSTPISMAFRLFGNISAGLIITSLLYSALTSLSGMLLGGLQLPILAIGLPAVLSVYFDLFTGFMQAFIISMLSMVFIAMAMD